MSKQPQTATTDEREPSSFRDPSGFVYLRNGEIFRQLGKGYAPHYEALMGSGLYDSLVRSSLLIQHVEVESASNVYKVIKPRLVPFISYPYEWCFSQLKDAALTTLQVQKKALEHNMTLKDASAYNIQFVDGKPLLIDTLSFACYLEGQPWVAYKQFCQHFLAPLALMSYSDVSLNQLLATNIDGVPLELASSLLPIKARLNPKLIMHLFMHAQQQKKHARHSESKAPSVAIPKDILYAMIEDLEAAIKGLSLKLEEPTEWSDYYANTNYKGNAASEKEKIVAGFLQKTAPTTVWDLGANVGNFSRLAAEFGARTTAMDIDPICVELNYQKCKENSETSIMPLLVNLMAPSPRLGWANEERKSLQDRGPVDTLMVLALVHHLAIGNNVPFDRIAEYLSRLGTNLIIEFVPKEDSQVKRLLACREDIFDNYDIESFEKAFSNFFVIEERKPVPDSERIIYLMNARR